MLKELAPVILEDDPAGQSVHVEESAAPVSFEKVPGGQNEHCVAADDENSSKRVYDPGAQAEQNAEADSLEM